MTFVEIFRLFLARSFLFLWENLLRLDTKKIAALNFKRAFFLLQNHIDVSKKEQNKPMCSKQERKKVMLKLEFNRVLLTYREWQLNNCYNKRYLLPAA